MPKRIAMTVEVNLDSFPGTFHEPEDFVVHLNRLLNDMFPWYLPTVTLSEEEPEQPERWIVTNGEYALGVYFSGEEAAKRWIRDNRKTGFYAEKLPKPDQQAVRDALAKLDGTVEAGVSLITGLSVEEIEDLGGVGTPAQVCGFALHRGEFCQRTDAHNHEHMPVKVGERIVCSCGDYNCASLDAVCTDPTCIDVGDDLVGHVHR